MPVIVGDPIVTDSGIVEAGQNLPAGAVLGRNGAGKLKLCAKKDANGTDITDGTQVPFAVLLEDVDASQNDKIAPILLMGQVDIDALVFGNGWDKESIKDALRENAIFAKQTM